MLLSGKCKEAGHVLRRITRQNFRFTLSGRGNLPVLDLEFRV